MNDHTKIPDFEGTPVSSTAIKMSGALTLDDLEGEVIHMDDVVQLISQYRCVGVHHTVNDKTGEVTRVQVLRPLVSVLHPIDTSDPDDIGILRARPQGKVLSSRPADDDE